MSNPKLIGNKCEGTIEVKRFYIEGVEMSSNCPKCGTETIREIGGDDCSYPELNKVEKKYFWCDGNEECGEEWEEDYIFELTVKLP